MYLFNTNLFILERYHTGVKSVAKDFLVLHILRYIKQFILKRMPSSVENVAKALYIYIYESPESYTHTHIWL